MGVLQGRLYLYGKFKLKQLDSYHVRCDKTRHEDAAGAVSREKKSTELAFHFL